MNTFRLRRHLNKMFKDGASHAEVYQAGIAMGEKEKMVSTITSMLPDREAAQKYRAAQLTLMVLLVILGLLAIALGVLELTAEETTVILGTIFIGAGILNILFARMVAVHFYAGYTAILILTILGIRHPINSIIEGDPVGFVAVAINITIIALCIFMLKNVFTHTSFFGKRLVPKGATKGFWE